ncbi:MAG: sterol desaturase family protein [Nannocystis sp.]|nr:sterol desaturase family protein [Nannocystis sp.]
MLVELAAQTGFFITWIIIAALAVLLMIIMSGLLFWRDYANPTFERWQRKNDPTYPSPLMVRREALQMLKGVLSASFCPALALYLVESGWSKAYAGLGGHSVAYLIFTFFVIWIGSDLYEWAYHRLGHTAKFWWQQHKGHHVFFNPTPFAVIADDHADQFLRSVPLLAIPLLMPVNMDLLFLTYGTFFYGYGVYLHWGHEATYPDAHHPWINTSFQHWVHHAKSRLYKPMHTGFFFKLWDQLAGSVYEAPPETCLCARCSLARGERTRAEFDAIPKPDYRPLLRPSFWLSGHPDSKDSHLPAPAAQPDRAA